MQDEMGPIQSSISNGFNFEVINSLDIGQTEPVLVTDPYSISYFALDYELYYAAK